RDDVGGHPVQRLLGDGGDHTGFDPGAVPLDHLDLGAAPGGQVRTEAVGHHEAHVELPGLDLPADLGRVDLGGGHLHDVVACDGLDQRGAERVVGGDGHGQLDPVEVQVRGADEGEVHH